MAGADDKSFWKNLRKTLRGAGILVASQQMNSGYIHDQPGLPVPQARTF